MAAKAGMIKGSGGPEDTGVILLAASDITANPPGAVQNFAVILGWRQFRIMVGGIL